MAIKTEAARYAVVKVVRTYGMTSAKQGSTAVVFEDGTIRGWVGGACAQPFVRKIGIECIKKGKPKLLHIVPPGKRVVKLNDEDCITVQADCGSEGEMEIYIEPRIRRERLYVIGLTPTAKALAKIAKILNYRVYYLHEKDLEKRRIELSDSIAIIATHQTLSKYADIDLLKKLLGHNVKYLALIASRKRASKLFASLRSSGFSEEEIRRVRSPAGISLGSGLTPQEIALSVMAEIVMLGKGGTGMKIANATDVEKDVAIDPICQMPITVEASSLKLMIDGKVYYFCSEACLEEFRSKNKEALTQPA